MKVLAFLPRASTFDVIHANCNSIFICVYHCNIYRVSITAIILTTCAISTLKLSTNLKRKSHCWERHHTTLHLVFSTQNISSLAELNYGYILNPCSWVPLRQSQGQLVLLITGSQDEENSLLPMPITKCKWSTEFVQNRKWPESWTWKVNSVLPKLEELSIPPQPLKFLKRDFNNSAICVPGEFYTYIHMYIYIFFLWSILMGRTFNSKCCKLWYLQQVLILKYE